MTTVARSGDEVDLGAVGLLVERQVGDQPRVLGLDHLGAARVADLGQLIERHLAETGSVKAADILQHWDIEKANFLQVCPKEMLIHLKHPLTEEKGAIPAE